MLPQPLDLGLGGISTLPCFRRLVLPLVGFPGVAVPVGLRVFGAVKLPPVAGLRYLLLGLRLRELERSVAVGRQLFTVGGLGGLSTGLPVGNFVLSFGKRPATSCVVLSSLGGFGASLGRVTFLIAHNQFSVVGLDQGVPLIPQPLDLGPVPTGSLVQCGADDGNLVAVWMSLQLAGCVDLVSTPLSDFVQLVAHHLGSG